MSDEEKYDETIANWKGMPKPKAIAVLSWEDIYCVAQQITQDNWKRDPTKEEVIAIFDDIGNDMDCEHDTFNSMVENACDEFYDELAGEK